MIQIYTYMITLCLFFWLTLHKQMRCKDFHHALANPQLQWRKMLVFTSWAYARKRWLSKALRWKTWASASGRVDLGLNCGLSSAVLRTSILLHNFNFNASAVILQINSIVSGRSWAKAKTSQLPAVRTILTIGTWIFFVWVDEAILKVSWGQVTGLIA